MSTNENFDPVSIWDEYIYLEQEFMNSLRYLPAVPEHYKVWSVHFADLLIRIGSVFDSFLKRTLFCNFLDDNTAAIASREKYMAKNIITIKDYYDVFEAYYKLSSKTVFNLITSQQIVPFSEWENNQYERLEWWKAYTDLKHDRFANKKVATLESTQNALASLFLVNILNPQINSLLVDYGLIRSLWSKESLKRLISKPEPIEGHEDIYAKTKLFGYVFETPCKHDIEKIWEILSPSYLEF